MRPVLFFLHGHPVGSYGFFMTAAHLAGVAALLFLARAHGRPIAPFLDLIFAVVVLGLAGARLGFAYNHWELFRANPSSVLSLWKGGLSFYGGFPFAFAGFVAVARWRKIPVLATGDLVCPVLPLSLGLIRMGCFLQGCCYGAPTDAPWAATFTRLDGQVPPHFLDRPIHPTQLYEFFFLLTLAAALAFAQRRNPFPPGVLATLSILAYAIYRLYGDQFRGDLDRGFWGVSWLSPTQGAAILGILAAPVVLAICYRRAREGAPS